MPKHEEQKRTVLALYPCSYGVGYAVFDANKLVVYGIGTVRPVNNQKSCEKVKNYIDFFRPDVVLLRELEPPRRKQNKRTAALLELIHSIAETESLTVRKYSRKQIKEVFTNFNAETKFQIMKKLVEWFPQLSPYEYPQKKEWMSEHHYAGLFDAVSLGVVGLYLE